MEEDLQELELSEIRKANGLLNDDDFFTIISREPFKETDKDVVLIDPGLGADIFEGIDLPCITDRRINNAINAPKS